MSNNIKKSKYIFNDIFYADLDFPKEEIKLFEDYIISTKTAELFYISIKKDKQNKLISNISCLESIDNIEDYIFIKSYLAGVGIDNFIVESNIKEIYKIIKIYFHNMTLKDYYKDDWIRDLLLKYDIKTIYKTDCDGDVLFIYSFSNDIIEESIDVKKKSFSLKSYIMNLYKIQSIEMVQ